MTDREFLNALETGAPDELFDAALTEALADAPPPEKTVETVTPWGDCMDRIVTGLVLTSFTLNFLWLQYILPAIGVANLYVAFRTLRGSGKYFRACWLLSGLRAGMYLVSLFMAASPLAASQSGFARLWSYAGMAVVALTYWCFGKALAQAHKDLGVPLESNPALAALVWYGVLCAVGLFLPGAGWLTFIIMLIAFVGIVKALNQTGKDLGRWGWAVKAAPVRVDTASWLARYYWAAAGLVLAVLFIGARLPAPAVPAPAPAVSHPAYALLEEQGFPAHLLAQLPEEELEKLAGADNCYVNDDVSNLGSQPMEMTTVYVKLTDTTVRGYTFFALPDSVTGCWRNGFAMGQEEDMEIYDTAAALRYQKGGQVYAGALAPESTPHTAVSIFGAHSYQRWACRFSWPFFAKERCGWFAYTMERPEPGWAFVASVDFYREELPLHMPWRDVLQEGVLVDRSQVYTPVWYDIETGEVSH